AWAAYRGLTGAFWAWRVARRRRRTWIGGVEGWANPPARRGPLALPPDHPPPPPSATPPPGPPPPPSLPRPRCAPPPPGLRAMSTTGRGERIVARASRAALAGAEQTALLFRVASRDGPWRLLSLGVDAEIPASHHASRPWPFRTATAAR